jgi:hypothetical protein
MRASVRTAFATGFHGTQSRAAIDATERGESSRNSGAVGPPRNSMIRMACKYACCKLAA